MIKPRAKKKKPARTSKAFDKKFLGEEPANIDFRTNPGQLVDAMSWHAHLSDSSKSLQWTIEWAKQNRPGLAERFEKIDPQTFSHNVTLGHRCRLQLRGCILTEAALESVESAIAQIDDLEERMRIKLEKKAAIPQTRRVPIVVRMISEVDDLISKFDGTQTEINIRVLMMKHNAPAGQVEELGKHYIPLLEELEELAAIDPKEIIKSERELKKILKRIDDVCDDADSGDCSWIQAETEINKLRKRISELDQSVQLWEAYRWLRKLGAGTTERYVDFIKSIVAGANYAIKAKKEQKIVDRPVPVKRAISAEKQTAQMRCMRVDDGLKLVSMSPAAMIGRKTVWLWHKKYAKIILWESDVGFEASGQSLKNVSRTIARTVKKPEEFFAKFEGTAARRKVLFEELKTTTHESTPRMSDNHLILFVG